MVESYLSFILHSFDVLESTNTTAREWIQKGAPEGTVIVAERQTAGRGRQGRTWTSLPGALLFSLILRPCFPASLLTRLGFYAAVGIALAAEQYGLSRAWLKWPNDLVLLSPPDEWAKWGGVLVETGRQAGEGSWAIVGIGLNTGPLQGGGESPPFTAIYSSPGVPQEPHPHISTPTSPHTPTPIQRGEAAEPTKHPPWASLSDALGRRVDKQEFLNTFLQEFTRLYSDGGNWEETLDAWRDRDVLYGRAVRASQDGRWIEGVARGINQEGALGLETPDGVVWLRAGEVHLG